MPERKVGLLVVPGMGEREQGGTVEALAAGLSLALGDSGRESELRRDGDGGPASISDSTSGTRVHFYGVSWADVLTKLPDEGSFDVDMVPPIAWYPLLNWRAALTEGGPREAAGTVLWTVLTLPFALLMWAGWGLVLLLRQMLPSRRVGTPNLPIARRTRGNRLDRRLDRLLGDVFTYANSSGGAYPRSSRLGQAADVIQGRFYQALRDAVDDGCDEIQVLAHSLGSVVAYHALTGYRLERGGQSEATFDPMARLTAIHTVASPLDKVRYIWPRLVLTGLLGPIDDGGDGLPHRVDQRPSPPSFSWSNYHYALDPVAGRLDKLNHWVPVDNEVLLTAGVVGSHLAYDRNRGFLAGITDHLFGEPLAPRRRLLRSVGDALRSLGHLLKAVALPALVIGAAGVVLAACSYGLPVLLGMGLDSLGLERAADDVVGIGPAVLVLAALAVAIVASYRQSVEVHRRVWVTPPPSRTMPDRRRRQA